MDMLSLPRAAESFGTELGTAPGAELGLPLHAVPHSCGSLSLCASVRAFVLGTSALVCHGAAAVFLWPLPISDFALGDIHVSIQEELGSLSAQSWLSERASEGGSERVNE